MGMAFDKTHNEIVVFGGAATAFPTLQDTWVYDVTGTNSGKWTLKPKSGQWPCSRHSTRMVWDEVNFRIVMFGGNAGTDCTGAVGGVLADTWVWDGSTWAPKCTGCTPGLDEPSERASEALSWDGNTNHNYVVLFGGTGNCSPSPCGDTWSWDGSAWTQRCLLNPACTTSGNTEPSARSASAMAYSIARNEVILHGGTVSGGGIVDGTWEWADPSDADHWLGLTGINSPPARTVARMAYDESSSKLVMFGGCTSSCTQLGGDLVTPTVNDTWILPATGNWTQMTSLPVGLTARCCVGMAYATSSPFSSLGNTPGIFMFGGEQTGGGKLGDMWFWYWNGAANWCQVKSATNCS